MSIDAKNPMYILRNIQKLVDILFVFHKYYCQICVSKFVFMYFIGFYIVILLKWVQFETNTTNIKLLPNDLKCCQYPDILSIYSIQQFNRGKNQFPKKL